MVVRRLVGPHIALSLLSIILRRLFLLRCLTSIVGVVSRLLFLLPGISVVVPLVVASNIVAIPVVLPLSTVRSLHCLSRPLSLACLLLASRWLQAFGVSCTIRFALVVLRRPLLLSPSSMFSLQPSVCVLLLRCRRSPACTLVVCRPLVVCRRRQSIRVPVFSVVSVVTLCVVLVCVPVNLLLGPPVLLVI